MNNLRSVIWAASQFKVNAPEDDVILSQELDRALLELETAINAIHTIQEKVSQFKIKTGG